MLAAVLGFVAWRQFNRPAVTVKQTAAAAAQQAAAQPVEKC
jgi:hypothetical protein